jgi:hypothetical protein
MRLLPVGYEAAVEVEILLARDLDLTSATVDSKAGFHHHESIPASWIGVLFDLEPAYGSTTMQELVVAAVLAHEVALLIGEVPFNQELASEIVVAGALWNIAFDAPSVLSVPTAGACHVRSYSVDQRAGADA